MKSKKKTSWAWRLFAVVVIIAVAWMKYQEQKPDSKKKTSKNTKTQTQENGYEWLKNCSLKNHRHNDGDSFHVTTSKGEKELRLYYVDTAESAAKTYRNGQNNYKRLAEQGKDLDGLNRAQTTQIGAEAKQFVTKLLSAQSFRVATQWEKVYGSSRIYAFVLVKWEGKEQFLHEILVSRGLARIHTKPMPLPDGTSVTQQKKHLYQLQKKAQKNALGAWGLR